MASRIDDRLFVALLRGDSDALATGWTTAFDCALAFAIRLFGSRNVSIRGNSAVDVASDATLKFVQAVASGQVTEGNVYGYLICAVHTTFVDLVRKARPESLADDRTADGRDSALDLAADPSPSQEQTMLAREEEEARERSLIARLQDSFIQRCEWPGTMIRFCGGCPALREMLEEIKTYTLQQLVPPQSHEKAELPATPLDVSESARALRMCCSFTALNDFLQARLGIGRTTLDQRWKRLRRIADREGIPIPPGLHGNDSREARRRKASRTKRPTPVCSEATLAPPAAGNEWTSTRTPAAATPLPG